MVVNDNAGCLDTRVVPTPFASKLAPTIVCAKTQIADKQKRPA
ncbi:hypothetical protein PS659_03433 [Pseudomonas fluorescens]|uniref:Uncharacterized protein n=1 Tax=Pseudomonas fluorescens TaxID=294 RepID=A0A5E6UC53_PSEFL|nr:hypothetical protein PS659_03433 [Pseudomonas fluorescens]